MLKKSHEIKLRERKRGLPNDPLRELRPFVVVPRDKPTSYVFSDSGSVGSFNSRVSDFTPPSKATENFITIPVHNVLTNRNQPSRRESFRVRPSMDKQPNGTTLVPQQARAITPLKRSLDEAEDNVSVHSIQVQRAEQFSFTQSTTESIVNPHRTYVESITSTYMHTDVEDNENRERHIPTEYQPLISSPIMNATQLNIVGTRTATQLSIVETLTSNITDSGSSRASEPVRDIATVKESTGIDVPVVERSESPSKSVIDEPLPNDRVEDVHDADSPTTNASTLEKTAVEINNVEKSIVDTLGSEHLTTDMPTNDAAATNEPVADTPIDETSLDKESLPTAENVDVAENAQIDEDIVMMDGVSDNENNKGVEDEATMNEDPIVERDATVERDTIVEKDAVVEQVPIVEKDTAVERATSVQKGPIVERDTAVENGDNVKKDAAVEQGYDTQHMMDVDMDVDMDDPIDYNNYNDYNEEELGAAQAQQSAEQQQDIEDIIDQDELINKMKELELLSGSTSKLKISKNATLHIKALDIVCTETMREMRRSLEDPFARSVIEDYYNRVIKSINDRSKSYDEYVRVSNLLDKLTKVEKKDKEALLKVDISRMHTQRKIAQMKKDCQDLTEKLKMRSDLDNFFTSVRDIAK